jgi:hypothetical protein
LPACRVFSSLCLQFCILGAVCSIISASKTRPKLSRLADHAHLQKSPLSPRGELQMPQEVVQARPSTVSLVRYFIILLILTRKHRLHLSAELASKCSTNIQPFSAQYCQRCLWFSHTQHTPRPSLERSYLLTVGYSISLLITFWPSSTALLFNTQLRGVSWPATTLLFNTKLCGIAWPAAATVAAAATTDLLLGCSLL